MSKIIDFHSHILPGVDHGSKNLETSLSQLKLMKKYGTDIAVATSHFYPEQMTLDDFLSKVDSVKADITNAATSVGIDLCLGAEVLVCEGLDKMEGLEKLCIRGTNCLLLEIPFVGTWFHGAVDTIERVIDNGFNVVLAHIDRYLADHEREIDQLIAYGAAAQINASAFSSLFTRKKVMAYVDSGCVYALGSDLHEADNKAYKAFAGVENRIGSDSYEIIMNKSEKLIRHAEILR